MSPTGKLPAFVDDTTTEAMPTSETKKVKVGKKCPECGIGILDYNGLLDLECPHCGFTEGPGGGCT